MHIFYAPTDTTFIDKLLSFIRRENEKLQYTTQIEIKQLHDREQIKNTNLKMTPHLKMDRMEFCERVLLNIFLLFCQNVLVNICVKKYYFERKKNNYIFFYIKNKVENDNCNN